MTEDSEIPKMETTETDPAILRIVRNPILQFFGYEHLRPDLQEVSKPFSVLAEFMVEHLPENAERSAGLRKLLEAKDCAVRAHLSKSFPLRVPASFTIDRT